MIKKIFSVCKHELISLEWSLGTAEVKFTVSNDGVVAEYENDSQWSRWKDIHYLEFSKLPAWNLITNPFK